MVVVIGERRWLLAVRTVGVFCPFGHIGLVQLLLGGKMDPKSGDLTCFSMEDPYAVARGEESMIISSTS